MLHLIQKHASYDPASHLYSIIIHFYFIPILSFLLFDFSNRGSVMAKKGIDILRVYDLYSICKLFTLQRKLSLTVRRQDLGVSSYKVLTSEYRCEHLIKWHLFCINPKQAGGSKSMYSLGGGRLAPPP